MNPIRVSRVTDRALAGMLADIAHELSSPFDWEARVKNALSLLCDIILCKTAALGVLFDGWHILSSPGANNPDELNTLLFEHYIMLTGEKPAEATEELEAALLSIIEDEDDIGSFLSLPVIGAGQVLGVLHVRTDEEKAYTARDASILSVVALQIGSFIKNEQLRIEEAHAREQIEHLSAVAEERTAELESFFAGIVDGVIVLNAEGEAILINQSGRKLLGLLENEPVRWWDYPRYDLNGNPIYFHEAASYQALHGKTIRDMRCSLITPRGDELIISVSSSPVRNKDGNIVGATIVFRDQRDRVEFERNRQELFEREQNIAQALQKALIPDVIPELPGLEIAAKYVPSLKEAEVGGDFYDIFDLSDGKVCILIGDVAGKGLLAAIQVAAIRHSIRSYAYIDPSPSRVMTLANNALVKDGPEGAMITAFFIVIDTTSGTISYANAGHGTPLVRNARGVIEELRIPGQAIGILSGYSYPEETRNLRVGDTIVLVTDGITEARIDSRELFGIEGIERYLSESKEASSSTLASGILDSAVSFAGGKLKDDVAIVVFTFKGTGSSF